MKVLLVAPASKASGGISRWTQHIKAYYDSLDEKIVELNFFDTARSEFIPDDIAFIPRVKLAIRDYRVIIRNFNEVFKKDKYDIVHITSSAGIGLLRDLYMIRAIKKLGSQCSIIHFRFGRIPELAKKKNWEWKLLCCVVKQADRILVLDKQSYKSLLDCGYTNVGLLSNMIAPGVEKMIRSMPPESRIPRRLLFVGHCIATKGVYELVKACKGIQSIRLVLIGAIKDDVRKDLLDISDGGDWLEILGEKPYSQVIEEMLKCDVFVLPTYTEGFPNVILESMACGCAIVTTPVGAIPEMLEEKEGKAYGIMVEPMNVQLLKKAIERLLEDEPFKQDCRKNVQIRVKERYSMSKVWDDLNGIWKEVSTK